MFGITHLYVEVDPQNLIEERTIEVPSTGFGAYVCKEIHPAFSVFLRLVK